MKKALIFLITLVSILTLVGCKSEKYTDYETDRQIIGNIGDLETQINNTYSKYKDNNNPATIESFKQYGEDTIKEVKKVELKTNPGDELRNAYIEKIDYQINYLASNWGGSYLEIDKDEGYIEIQRNISELISSFNINMDNLRIEKDEKDSKINAVYVTFGLVIGTILFIIINKIFNILYFGFKGMFLTWVSCVAISSYVIVPLLGGLIVWGIGILGLLALISIVISKVKKTESKSNE